MKFLRELTLKEEEEEKKRSSINMTTYYIRGPQRQAYYVRKEILDCGLLHLECSYCLPSTSPPSVLPGASLCVTTPQHPLSSFVSNSPFSMHFRNNEGVAMTQADKKERLQKPFF